MFIIHKQALSERCVQNLGKGGLTHRLELWKTKRQRLLCTWRKVAEKYFLSGIGPGSPSLPFGSVPNATRTNLEIGDDADTQSRDTSDPESGLADPLDRIELRRLLVANVHVAEH